MPTSSVTPQRTIADTVSRPLTAALATGAGIALADVGLSQWSSGAFGLDAVPLLSAATTLLLAAAGLAVAAAALVVDRWGFRGAHRDGLWVASAAGVIVVYELLRWRQSGLAAPAFWPLAALILAAATLASRVRPRTAVIGLGVVAVVASVAWSAAALAIPGGNPTLRALAASRHVVGPSLAVGLLSAIWLTLVATALLYGHDRQGPRGQGLWGRLALTPLLLAIGWAWLAVTHPLLPGTAPAYIEEHAAATAPAAAPNIVMLVLDTVRADRTDLIEPTRGTTPALRRLGERGAVYTRAYANSSSSLPSHASLFTGLYPHRHGAVKRVTAAASRPGSPGDADLEIDSVALDSRHSTLAEELAHGGYETVAFSANHGYFSPVFGLLEGFSRAEARARNILAIETVIAPFMRRGPARWEAMYRWYTRSILDSGEWANRAIAWLGDRNSSAPFFLFMNWSDAHEAAAIGPRAEAVPAGSAAAVDSKFQLYDAALRYQDATLERFLQRLSDLGLADNTIVIVTADHGEDLSGDGPKHAGQVSPDQVWVPLVVRVPATAPARIDDPVQLADLPATVLELAGLPPLAESDGTSLARDGVLSLRPASTVLLESYFADTDPAAPVTWENVDELRPTTWALFEGPWKLMRDARGFRRLFDVATDPSDTTDLAPGSPETADRIDARLRELLPSDIDLWRLEIVERQALDPATLERLRSLGYIQ